MLSTAGMQHRADWKPRPGDMSLVTDIRNNLLPGGSLAVSGGEELVPILNRYIEAFASQGLPVYATRDWHPQQHCSFRPQGGSWPIHCVAGAQGAQFAAALTLPRDATVISKATSRDQEANSSFQGTDLACRMSASTRQRISPACSQPCVVWRNSTTG